MKIKTILSALLLMVSTVASAQYLNVKMEDGTYRSFYWSPRFEWYLDFYIDFLSMKTYFPDYGMSVRPVSE